MCLKSLPQYCRLPLIKTISILLLKLLYMYWFPKFTIIGLIRLAHDCPTHLAFASFEQADERRSCQLIGHPIWYTVYVQFSKTTSNRKNLPCYLSSFNAINYYKHVKLNTRRHLTPCCGKSRNVPSVFSSHRLISEKELGSPDCCAVQQGEDHAPRKEEGQQEPFFPLPRQPGPRTSETSSP